MGNQATRAATWRNARGEIIGYTYPGTVCDSPRKPYRLKITRDGFEHIIRCGACPGCVELDRIRLERQLYARYSGASAHAAARGTSALENSATTVKHRSAGYYVVRVYAPLGKQARLAHALHRRRGLDLEPGFWRLGARSFALLTRGLDALRRVLAKTGVECRAEPLRLSRGRRAFRPLTAGLQVAREIYGEQTNRWYVRGLPPREKETWAVARIGHYVAFDRRRGPRARRADGATLHPPELFGLLVTDRRALRRDVLRQTSPEGVSRVMGLVADALRKIGGRYTVTAAAKRLLGREQVARWYAEHAERTRRSSTLSDSASDIIPPALRGGYGSSEHEQGELLPRELARQREIEAAAARKRRIVNESMAIIERMAARAAERRE